jgi:DNA-binding FadR family transcriptional regulator
MRAYEVLALRIRERIAAGELSPGERLPPEMTLAERFEVSRPTVREALRLLEESGLVERSSPKILRVKPAEMSLVSREFTRAMVLGDVTFRELMDAIFVIDPALAQLAARNPDEQIVAELTANLEQQAEHFDDYGTWWRLDQKFHQDLATMSRNRALTTARASVMDTVAPALGSMVSRDQAERGTHHHRRILEEVALGDPDGARLMSQKHVRDAFSSWEEAGFDLDLTLTEWRRQAAASLSTRSVQR